MSKGISGGMKRLAIITGSMSRGGAERVALNLAKYIFDKGFKVFLMTSTKSENEYIVPAGIKRIVLDENLTMSGKFVRILSISRNLKRVIIENNIDTVLIMGVPLCLFAIPGCRGTGVKVIVSERNDPIHFEGKRIVQFASRKLLKQANGFVCQTNEARAFYKYLNGVIIPNPIMVDDLCEPYHGTREKSIVTAGRMISQKNQRLLLESFNAIKNSYPDYKLIIYGEGILRKELEEYVQKHDLLEKVEMPGNVTNLLEKIKTAGLFVLSSNFEGMPNVLMEAMALGLPCISTDCPSGGPRSLIHNGKNGLLVSVGNKVEIVEAMKRLLEDRELADHLGTQALRIREDLSMSAIGDRWINYMETVSPYSSISIAETKGE